MKLRTADSNHRSFFQRLHAKQRAISGSVAAHAKRTRTFETLEQRHMLSADSLFDDTTTTYGPYQPDDQVTIHTVSTVQQFDSLVQQIVAGQVAPPAQFQMLTAENFNTFQFTEEQPFAITADGRLLISSSTAAGFQTILDNELLWYVDGSTKDYSSYTTRSVSFENNPLFANQWHLLNAGQQVGQPDYQFIRGTPGVDINVLPVWEQGYTGAGVVVAVVDSGVELLHPDLIDNIVPGLQFDALDGGNNPNPNFLDPTTAHGTAVAGIIGAVDNDIGGVGVAPGVGLAGIRLIDAGQDEFATIDVFRYQTDLIDIYNHSWGPADIRQADGPSAGEVLALRDGFYFGRGGLGSIHVWAGGNGAGSDFIGQGNFDYASYDGYVNSRYTIGVGGYDHDGLYANVDGTVTGYPESGPSILVSAPTGSNALQIGLEDATGSGIVTSDLTGDFGYNFDPALNGEQTDRDYLEDTDYTSLFNGTSASTPMVSGVIALMLEANPNLSFRDIQEILIRSAQQIAQFEIPDTGLLVPGAEDLLQGVNSWIVNQDRFFHDPDDFGLYPNPIAQFTPVGDANDPIEAAVWNTGAGYTVSQGRGSYNEPIGYGHGAIDAELAVALAEVWHELDQDLAPELTFTTFIFGLAGVAGAQQGNGATGNILIPGGFGGGGNFAAYWDEYYEDAPFTMNNPVNSRGATALPFAVPDNNAMEIEWVELRANFTGNWDNVRLTLVSPNGTTSEFNHYFLGSPVGSQPDEYPVSSQNPAGDALAGAGNWVMSTNRSWGERSDSSYHFNPVTGDPYFVDIDGLATLDPTLAADVVERNWELRVENWGATPVSLGSVELVWHGTPLNPETQRIQGYIGVDENLDGLFNFERYQQEVIDLDMDTDIVRHAEVTRTVDETQEDFAENVIVSVRRASDNFVVDRFITGHDGNYYFDLLPDTYIVGIEAPEGYTAINDANAPADFLPKYLAEWIITPDHFTLWDHDRPDISLQATFDPVTDYDIPLDPTTGTPVQFQITDSDEDSETFGQLISVPANVRGINFLLSPTDLPAQEVNFSGVVFADNNGDGIQNTGDTPQGGIRVYIDVNLNNAFDGADLWTVSDANGAYSFTLEAENTLLYQIGVDEPFGWTPTSPTSGLSGEFIAQVGAVIDSGLDFLIAPPGVDTGGGGPGGGGPGGGGPGGGGQTPTTGSISGSVFLDADIDGVQDPTESGIAGYTVYLDLNFNGVRDNGETTFTTNGLGQYFFSSLAVRTYAVRLENPVGFAQTSPSGGSGHVVNLRAGDVVAGRAFGVQNQSAAGAGTITGAVFLDNNGNGVRNSGDLGIPGFQVYIDANGDNQFNIGDGDIPATMNISGGFAFNSVAPGIHTIRLETLSGYEQTAPVGDEFVVNLPTGGAINNLEFGVESLVAGQLGNLSGTVYLDANANSMFDASESGIVGFNVYVDANNDGSFNATDGDLLATSNINGSFAFADVPAGVAVVRIEVLGGFRQTDPLVGGANVIEIVPDETTSGLLFGVTQQTIGDFDYGDLPLAPTRLADSGARHLVVPGFSLGLLVDKDPDGQPNSTATGDDMNGVDDEDGITLLGNGTLMPGTTANFRAVVNGTGLYLNAWMDLNGDGTFNNGDEWIIRDDDVAPGTHDYAYAVPSTLVTNGPVAMRWRLGSPTTAGHDFRGDDIIGEVEDYFVPLDPSIQPVVDTVIAGDYDGSGYVDQLDYSVWRQNFGTNSPAADGNGDGRVDAADYTVWRDNLGAGIQPQLGGLLLSFGEGEGSGSGGSDGTATRSGYTPFASGDPNQYVSATSAVGTSPFAMFAGLATSSEGSSVSAVGTTFGSSFATQPSPDTTPSQLDLYFDQLADEGDDDTSFFVDDEAHFDAETGATDLVFATALDEDFWP